MKKTAELCQTRDNRLGVPGLSYAFCPSQSLDLDQFIIEIAKCNLSCIGVFCPYFLSQDQFLFRVKSHSASQNYQYSHKLNVMSVVTGYHIFKRISNCYKHNNNPTKMKKKNESIQCKLGTNMNGRHFTIVFVLVSILF